MSILLTAATLSHAAALRNSYPISMILWVAGNMSGDSYPISQESGSGSVHFKLDGNSSGEAAQDYSTAQGAIPASKSASPHISPTTMQLAVAVFTSASSRTVYFGSATGVTTTTTQSSPSIATHNILKVGSSASTFNMAEAHVFNTALTASDVTSLLGGTLPETITGWIDGWTFKDYSAGGSYTSIGGTRTISVASGTVAAGTLSHPVTRASSPTVSTQPSNQSVVTGTTATFTTAWTGSPTGYQWQRSTDGGTNWNNVTDGTGGTTNTYTTAATTLTGGTANNGDRFRCVATNGGGSTNSNAAILTVNAAATAVTLTGPTTGTVNAASSNFTVGANGGIVGTITVTPSDGGAGGTFNPTSINLTSGSPTGTFTYTATSSGAKTISVTNNAALTNPSSITYTASSASATALSMTGPSGGSSGVASTNFTVSTNGTLAGTVTVTPSDGGGGGSFSPTTLTLNSGTLSGTFTYTPASAGAKTISITNNGGLSNPSNITYTATAQGTITTPSIKNNTGTLLASISGWYCNVYNSTTGALVVKKTALTSNSSGVITFTDPSLIAGTVYAFELGHATYGRRLPVVTST